VLRARRNEIPLTYNVWDGAKLVLMIGDIRLKEEEVGVAGDVYILDASIATPALFAKFTPSFIKKFLVCVQVSHICYCYELSVQTERIMGRSTVQMSKLHARILMEFVVVTPPHPKCCKIRFL
jgi:hypothetical protein